MAIGSRRMSPFASAAAAVFSEAMMELITPPCDSVEQALAFLNDLQVYVYSHLREEILWATSMPCIVEGGENIARYSFLGKTPLYTYRARGNNITISGMEEKNYPFSFITEASVDLANDSELMELMVDCNFKRVFFGIETPDEASLALTQKYQNTRDPLSESVDKITRAGLQVMAGFIIGFDNEKTGAGDRIVRFVEQNVRYT